MMQKLNKLYEEVIAESTLPVKRFNRKRVRVKNVVTKKNVDQFCEGETRKIKTPLTQKPKK